MIDKKDIKVGKKFIISREKLIDITSHTWVSSLYEDPCYIFTIEIVDMLGDRCEIKPLDQEKTMGVSVSELARVLTGSVGDFKESIEGKIALRYMNEQRSKAIATDGVRRFEAITAKMLDTYKAKNHDYGNAFSEMYDELGINYGYCKIREKVNRIKTLKDSDAQVANEPLEDALLDCANYCILTLMEYQKRKEDGKV